MSETKFVLSLDERSLQTMEHLQASTGASGFAEVLRDAIGFYEWARMHVLAGESIGVINRDGNVVSEVVMKFHSPTSRK